jgi:hypothetical protein
MSPPDENGANPYQAPEALEELAGDPVRSTIDPGLVKNFRQQIHALGGLWIIIGSAALAYPVAGFGARSGLWGDPGDDFFSSEVLVLLVVAAVAGSVYLFLGVAACLKHMWAVYAGLVLSYFSLLGQLFSLNICSIIITLAVIVQAHRVIGWSKQMHAAGVPLTAKPDTIARKEFTGDQR